MYVFARMPITSADKQSLLVSLYFFAIICEMALQERRIASIDIGGTGVRGAGVTPRGRIATEVMRYAHAGPNDSAQAIPSLRNLAGQISEVTNGHIVATGVGMPNPSDYERGILRADHKPNLAPLSHIDLREVLAPHHGGPGIETPIFFLNDGDALGLGAIREYPKEKRLMVMGLGTGLGASFAVDGHLATTEDGTPPGREIWDLPFREGKLEDYVSRQAIIDNYAARSGRTDLDVRVISILAREGNIHARAAFATFAQALGEGAAMIAQHFHPTRIVLGGNIGIGAYDLIGEPAHQAFVARYEHDIPLSPARNPNLPLVGAARYAQSQLR